MGVASACFIAWMCQQDTQFSGHVLGHVSGHCVRLLSFQVCEAFGYSECMLYRKNVSAGHTQFWGVSCVWGDQVICTCVYTS